MQFTLSLITIVRSHGRHDYLERYIPLVRAMQSRLERCAAAGLAMTRVTLREHGEIAEIVITDSTLKFLWLARETLVAECARPDATTVEKFIHSDRQRGKARSTVALAVRAAGEPAMTFTGHYAIYRPETG